MRCASLTLDAAIPDQVRDAMALGATRSGMTTTGRVGAPALAFGGKSNALRESHGFMPDHAMRLAPHAVRHDDNLG